MNRSFQDVMELLTAIENKEEKLSKRGTICYALRYGLGTGRTSYQMEDRLYNGDMFALLDEIETAWDGNEFIMGVLHTFHEIVHNPEYLPVDTGEELPQLTFAPAPDQQLRLI